MRVKKYRVYKTRRGWTWELKSGNGEPVSRAGEPFKTKHNAVRSAKRHKEIATQAEITVEEDGN